MIFRDRLTNCKWCLDWYERGTFLRHQLPLCALYDNQLHHDNTKAQLLRVSCSPRQYSCRRALLRVRLQWLCKLARTFCTTRQPACTCRDCRTGHLLNSRRDLHHGIYLHGGMQKPKYHSLSAFFMLQCDCKSQHNSFVSQHSSWASRCLIQRFWTKQNHSIYVSYKMLDYGAPAYPRSFTYLSLSLLLEMMSSLRFGVLK